MTTIRLYRHPFSSEPPEVIEAESLALWLLDHYGSAPKVRVQVYAGGEPSTDTEITGNVAAIMRCDAPVYVVLESPGVQFVPQIIMMVFSLALNYMMSPVQHALNNRDQQSPNNQLSNRENRVRMMERVEDIYGTVRSIPSLMMPTYSKYIQNQKVEYGYYCVGRGYYDISDLRDGDTLLSEIGGASAAVYAPFTSPNSGSPQLQIGDAIIDPILTVRRSGSVDGITLKPTNQLQPMSGLSYYLRGAGTAGAIHDLPPTSLDIVYQPAAFPNSRKPNLSAIAFAGQSITLTMVNTTVARPEPAGLSAVAATRTIVSTVTGFFRGLVNGQTITFPGFSDPTNTTAKTVVSHTGETVTVAEVLADEIGLPGDLTADVNYSGTRTISAVENGYVTLTGAVQFYEADAEAFVIDVEVDNGLVDWSDWATLPMTDRTEVWTNVSARNGVYKDDGAKSSATVEYEIQIEQLTSLLVPTGVVETVTGSLYGSSSNELGETLEHVTAWVGPARVRGRRTTPFDYEFEGLVVDEIQWVDLHSVSPVDPVEYPHFGNKTTVHTITKGNADATTLRRRELNCLAARKLPTYNGSAWSGAFDSTGLLVSGSIYATSKLVDIIAAVTIDPKIGNRAITDIDLAQIWSVQQALDAWNANCGVFSHTFDSDTLSYEETLVSIANAGFCAAYRQNGKIRLALDRPQATSIALFTHRNKRPKAESITRKFASDSEYDGVELSYQDPDTESQETIRLPMDGSYTKLKKVEVPGIRNFTQAWLRANRELYRLRAQRLTIETETTTDARAILPNSRIDIVDNTRFKSYDGEVVGQSGLALTLSRDVEFIPATAHSIVLMKRDGSLQSIACTAGAEANEVVLASTPAEAIVTDPSASVGIRTIFSFAADSARGAMAWLVQEIGVSDGQYIRIRAVNYSDDYYAADDEAIPAKEAVIY